MELRGGIQHILLILHAEARAQGRKEIGARTRHQLGPRGSGGTPRPGASGHLEQSEGNMSPRRAPRFAVHPLPLAFLSGRPFASVPPSFPLPPLPLGLCPSQPPLLLPGPCLFGGW